MPDHDPLHHLDDDDDLDELDELDDLDLPEDIAPELIELDKMPRSLWEQALAPLRPQQRVWVARQVSDARLRDVAMALATELDFAECDRRRERDEARFAARRIGHPLPAPSAVNAATRPTVQLNVRLRRDDHERLTRAAAAVGMKPTTLARALMLNGAASILREHAASEHPNTVRRRTPGYP
jgi:hypothetical protein